MEIKIGSSGGKPGPTSGFSGGMPPSGPRKRHASHSNPHSRDDGDMEAYYDAADKFGAAVRDGNREGIYAAAKLLKRLLDHDED